MKAAQLVSKTLNGILKFKMGRSSPLFVSYNVTGKCNLHCIFCDWWKNSVHELPTKQSLEVIDSVCSLGVPFFDLSGGEPMLRKDLIILAKRIQSYGSLVSMNTNGTLLKDKIVKKMAKVFDTVVVSLDGPKQIHDKIRGVTGTYNQAMKGIKQLRINGIRTGINTVLTPWNIDFLPEFLEKIRSKVDFIQIQPIHCRNQSTNNNFEKVQLSSFINYLLDLKHSEPGLIAVPSEFIKGFQMYIDRRFNKICDAGKLYIAINPEGKLLACPARSDLVIGNLLMDSIHDSLKYRSNDGWREVNKCRGCWLECTVGVSMLLRKPFNEIPQIIRIWMNKN